MRKKRKRLTNRSKSKKRKKEPRLSEITRSRIWGVIFFALGLIFVFSLFNLGGEAGSYLIKFTNFLVGEVRYICPLVFFIVALLFFVFKSVRAPFLIGFFSFIFISGFLAAFDINHNLSFTYSQKGGWLGTILAYPLIRFFGFWITQIIFLSGLFVIIIIGLHPFYEKRKGEEEEKREGEKKVVLKKAFLPKFKVSPIEEPVKIEIKKQESSLERKEEKEKREENKKR